MGSRADTLRGKNLRASGREERRGGSERAGSKDSERWEVCIVGGNERTPPTLSGIYLFRTPREGTGGEKVGIGGVECVRLAGG